SPDYLVNHEKESFVKRLTTRSQAFSIEDIYKILNFVDVEILGIGKSLEINEEFVGSTRSMLDVFSMIRKAAPSDLPVFIAGENGTGKEMTARAIYERSSRREHPFVTVDCAAMREDLLEAELFGYEKGAVPGMNWSKPGKLEEADHGTIFVDDIGGLSPALQARLMKFLEERIVERIGAKGGRQVDVRVITAAGKSLKPAISDGKFSRDLFNRLNAFCINLFPLRDRGEDKLILARYFLNKFAREMNVSKTFTKEALDLIKNYDWPGNVREMINKVRMTVIMSPEMDVTAADLDVRIPAADLESITTLRDVRGAIEKQKLTEALNICNNNISKTAKVLGISRPSVYSLKKKYEI
ncbi:MAG TPA: sigma-54-dependent Fis family transcriptional regulator, partial [Nitrospirae bacterium]|nr:sigma-54-dependent Fis family transcriptional regulator [Nitrospirota bacterium]